MNNSNFVQTEGYPLTSERLQELQTTFQIFKSFGNIAGNLTILEGCGISGTNIQNGVVFINGEPLDFREASFDAQSTVIIIEETVTKAFKNGTVKEVYKVRYATIGTAEVSWPWSSFIRPPETKTLKQSLDTINDRLQVIETKLGTIAEGAEVNVQSDWNVTDNTSDAFIKNKITVTSPFLRVNFYNIGDPVIDQRYVVTFPTVGTANYMVLGGIKVNSGSWDLSNDVIWTWGAPGETSFELYIREVAEQVQNIRFYYALIPIP